jgi:hypothetical protein
MPQVKGQIFNRPHGRIENPSYGVHCRCGLPQNFGFAQLGDTGEVAGSLSFVMISSLVTP